MENAIPYRDIFRGYLEGLKSLDLLETRVRENDPTVFDEEDSETVELVTQRLFEQLQSRLSSEKSSRAKMLRGVNSGSYVFSDSIKDLRLKLIFRGLEAGNTLEEVNRTLRAEGFRELFPKNLLEACIIFCLSNGKDLRFLETLYAEAERLVRAETREEASVITPGYLRSIIRENTEGLGEAVEMTRAITNRLRADIAECDSEADFLMLLQTDIAENISDVANLQRFYTALYLYYLTDVFIEEILQLNEAARTRGELFRQIDAVRVENGRLRNADDARDALEAFFLRERFYESNRGCFCRRLFTLLLRSGSTYTTAELFEKAVADLFGPGHVVSKLTQKAQFSDLPINIEFVAGILYRDVAKIERDQGNNATRIRNCLMKKASFSRDAFLGFISLCAMYIRDVMPDSIKNEKHRLWTKPEARLNRILQNCHLGTLDADNNFTDALALCCLESGASPANISELLFEIADGQEETQDFAASGVKVNAKQFWLANESSKSSFVLTQEFLTEMHRFLQNR